MSATKSGTWAKAAPPTGEVPAVALIDPKYPHNVGMVVRLASCYGLRQVWFTGDRVSLTPARGDRLPREERMKGYRDVTMVHHDHVFDRFPPGTVPVAVEVRAAAEPLHTHSSTRRPRCTCSARRTGACRRRCSATVTGSW